MRLSDKQVHCMSTCVSQDMIVKSVIKDQIVMTVILTRRTQSEMTDGDLFLLIFVLLLVFDSFT
jgi:hypothetical protein